jgi:tetratricopeptide (TPR) repeat protein
VHSRAPDDLQACLLSADIETVFKACSSVIAAGQESKENLARAHLRRARAWAGAGRDDPDRAMADYDAAIRLDPNLGEAFDARGLEWQDRGELDRAIADFTEAIRVGVKSGRIEPMYQHRGIALRDKGEFGRAIADFSYVIAGETQSHARADALQQRGITKRAQRDLEGAIADFNEAIGLNWRVECVHADRGWAWLLKGDAGAAIADFGAVFAKLENKAKFAHVLYGRGLSRQHLGDRAAGDADIAAAQVIDRRLVRQLAKVGPALLKGDAKTSAAEFDALLARFYDTSALASALYGRGLLRIGWVDPTGGNATSPRRRPSIRRSPRT